MQKIFGHSVDISLLNEKGWILDVGGNSGIFAEHFANLGFKVLCVEPNCLIEKKNHENIFHETVAVVPSSMKGPVDYIFCSDIFCNHVKNIGLNTDKGKHHVQKVNNNQIQGVTISDLMQKYNIKQFEVAKFDCEGGEITLLECDTFAKQITVEFHEHLGQEFEDIAKIMNHLQSLGYQLINNDLMDMLFVLK